MLFIVIRFYYFKNLMTFHINTLLVIYGRKSFVKMLAKQKKKPPKDFDFISTENEYRKFY